VFGRRLHGQVCRLLALQNAIRRSRRLAGTRCRRLVWRQQSTDRYSHIAAPWGCRGSHRRVLGVDLNCSESRQACQPSRPRGTITACRPNSMVRLAAKGADRRALTKLRNFVSAIASKTRKLTSAAALPLSTARSSLETNLSRSFSTATTKHLLFRLTAFAKSQRGSHECASLQILIAATNGCCLLAHHYLLPPSPPAEKAHRVPVQWLFWTDGCCTGTVLIVVHHMGAASNGGRFRIEADAQPSSIHANPAHSKGPPGPGGALRFPPGPLQVGQ